MGRLITLKTPENALQILKRIAMNLGSPKSINVAAPQDRAFDEILVTRVAVCAGSGSSILGQADNADMLVTGEMSHHEVLAATENGKVVVSLGHSNSERQYLNDRMRPKLLDALKQENGPNFKDVAVEISEADRDPFVSFVRR